MSSDPPKPQDGGSNTRGSDRGGADDTDPDEFVLTFEDITVHVPESEGCLPCCSCKDSPLRNYGVEYFGMSVEERAAFYTLDRLSGCVKSGEVSEGYYCVSEACERYSHLWEIHALTLTSDLFLLLCFHCSS